MRVANFNLQNLLGFLLLMPLVGCLEVENQALAPRSALLKINPAPVPRDFARNNADHRVLIAIIDTGVDYNHPALLSSVHFDLDQAGRPTGTGYDYLGNDAWPSPYIARTFELDPDAPRDQKERSKLVRGYVSRIIAKRPGLAQILDPARSIEVERGFGYHGTHVAALASYGIKQIGILPYRSALSNAHYDRENLDAESSMRNAQFGVLDGIRRAIAHGARVINLSLSFTPDEMPPRMRPEFPKLRDAFAHIAISHPEVVFVAAAGNSGGRLVMPDADQMPCGLKIDNVICVTAVDEAGRRAEFSNVVDTGLLQIAAWGTDVPSAIPTLMCGDTFLQTFLASGLATSLPDVVIDGLASQLATSCQKHYMKESGTSMSTPLVSREIARIMIAQPDLSGTEVIKILLRNNPSGQINPDAFPWTAADVL